MSFPVVDGLRGLELGTPGAMRQRLNALVLAGAKVATFGLAQEYAEQAEPLERVGERLALVDDAGARLATVAVTDVRQVPAGAVTWAMVEAEGEGDQSIAEWRAGHDRFWRAEGRPPLADDTELVWVRFQLVDPAPPVHRLTAGDLGLPEGYRGTYSGKVRELFSTPDGALLFVASDRISAYDHVLPTPIPDKGAILTQLSLWWFEQVADLVGNHVLPGAPPASVAQRAMRCQPLDMVPVECVARGYLTGSGLVEYRASGAVCGVPLPAGLVDGSKLPEAIFTPATKAQLGSHDENVDFAVVERMVGAADARALRELTLAVYGRAEAIARQRGIILADTKFEFGRAAGDRDAPILLADEVLTPDSSRFWPADQWQPGRPGGQPSFDKQYVRDWLTSPASGWDRGSDQPPPPLPEAVVERTRSLYVRAYEQLTGRRWG
ncbi:MAG TPA: phosphoribosylaminoimidazolesuccinocarboxamide synthase [Candidatus Nanopelagicales bacterium]